MLEIAEKYSFYCSEMTPKFSAEMIKNRHVVKIFLWGGGEVSYKFHK